jgi:hypothetical protein
LAHLAREISLFLIAPVAGKIARAAKILKHSSTQITKFRVSIFETSACSASRR